MKNLNSNNAEPDVKRVGISNAILGSLYRLGLVYDMAKEPLGKKIEYLFRI